MARKAKLAGVDIGDLGEDDFKSWCTASSLFPTKVDRDRMGWDYLVEFKDEVDHAVPLDRQSDLKKVFVQVKATRTKTLSVSGKLSAFRLLVQTDFPAFIVHIYYFKQRTANRALLLHIGPTQIEAILRKVREAEKRGRLDLHNITMTLSLDEALSINSDGNNLQQLILRAVPQGTAEYVRAKSSIRKSCGYDAHSIAANLSLTSGEEALVDLMLGIAPQLSVNELTISRKRFGIALDRDIDRLSGVTLRVDVKPFQQGKVVALSFNQGSRVEMSVDVFTPGIPNLPSHLQKVRMLNEFVELILQIGSSKTHFTYRVNPVKRYPVQTLTNALKFGLVLAEDDGRLEIELGKSRVSAMSAPHEAKQLHRWHALQEFAELFSVALSRHRMGVIVETTLRELEEAFERNLNRFLVLARPGLDVTFAPHDQMSIAVPANATVLTPTCIELGSHVYYAIVKIPSKDIIPNDDGSFRVIGDRPTVVADGLLDLASLNITDLNQRAANFARHENGFVIVTSLTNPDKLSEKT